MGAGHPRFQDGLVLLVSLGEAEPETLCMAAQPPEHPFIMPDTRQCVSSSENSKEVQGQWQVGSGLFP